MAKTQGLDLLTDRKIKAAKPGDEMNDGGGLLLRVRGSGAKSFSWRGRIRGAGNPVRVTLGSYPTIFLKTARQMASDVRKAAATGEDPRKLFKQEPSKQNTLREVVGRWQRHAEAQGSRSAKERVRALELHVLPILGEFEVQDVSKGAVFALLEDLRDGKGVQKRKLRAQANRVLSALKTVLGYAYDADLIVANPIAGMKPPINEAITRHSVLLDIDDLVAVWNAADNLPSIAAPITKLLILTGLRREEITGLRWDEFAAEGRTLTISAERFKGKRAHRIPLSQTAVKIIQEQSRFPHVEHVFNTGMGRGSFAGWRRAASRLRELAALDHATWHIHDIRRGVATAWGEHLNVHEHSIARLLGHSGASRMGITATYEKSDRIEHLRQPVDAWDKFLQTRLDGGSPNVVPIHAGAT